MKRIKALGVFALFLTLIAITGCKSNSMTVLEQQIKDIQIGQNDLGQVSTMLDQKGMLNTARSISVLETNDQMINDAKELAIVVFDEKNSTATRTIYVRASEDIGHKRFKVAIKSQIPAFVLEQTYATTADKLIAVIGYMHGAVIADGREYENDQESQSLIGAARELIISSKREIAKNPRYIYKLEDDGFEFVHMNMGKSTVTLTQMGGDIFILTIDCGKFNDPLID
ncbi:MAG: hypothetical protein JEZ07_02025 [Phycisphaerae bacterium]|nr:hypothetical protein [Phycisphaerae bacterium]